MKNFKKILFTFMCLFLVGIVNVEAKVTVNGETLTGTKEIGGGKITWNATEKTLTIDNVKTTVNKSKFIGLDESATIILKGINEITNTGKIISAASANASGLDIVITSPEGETGSLKTTTGTQSIEVNDRSYVSGSLIIDNVKLDLTSTSDNANSSVIDASGVTIKNNSDVKVNAKKYGIRNYAKLIVENSKLDVTSTDSIALYQQMMAKDDIISIEIKNSTVDVNSSKCAISYLSTNSTMTIDNSLLNVFGVNMPPVDEIQCISNPTFTNLGDKVLFVSENADGSNASILELNEDTDLTQYKYMTVRVPIIVTTSADSNSNVTLSNETVIEGSTVEATITTNKGYKLTSVLVNGVESIDSLVDSKLILTVNENTTIKVTSKAYEKEVEVPTIDTTKEVKEVTVGVKTDDTVNATLEKALEESDIDVSGFDSKVEIAVKNQNNNAVPEKDMESIKALVKTKENVKVSSYFDITINVVNTDSNQVIGTLPELSKELTFNVQLPTTLAKVEEGYTRTYYIIRYHNGKSEILDASVSGNTLTFKSNKFSTYALAYSDVKSEDKTIVDEDKTIINKDKAEVKPAENPKTTDDGAVYILITLISILGIASECRFIKK